MKENKKEYIIVTVCPFCGHINEIGVNEDDYWDWQDGELVQNAFPYLSADEREVLISGLCYDCQSDLFEDDEEDWDGDSWDAEIGYNPYEGCYDWDC